MGQCFIIRRGSKSNGEQMGIYPIQPNGTYAGEITIPDFITEIPNDIRYFYNNQNITKINLSKNLSVIGNNAFYGCTGLTEIVLPSTLTEIRTSAFYNCKNLCGEIVLPDSLESLGDLAFYECYNVESFELSALNNIGRRSFYNCNTAYFDTNKIRDVNSVTIGEYAFYTCKMLTSRNVSDILAPNKIINFNSSSGYIFANCIGLTEKITIGKISNYMFNGCRNLEEVEIAYPNNNGDLALAPFSGCESLRKIILPLCTSSSSYLNSSSKNNRVTYLGSSYEGANSPIEEIVLANGWMVSANFSDNSNLTHDSIISMFDALADLTGSNTQILTLGTDNLNKLTMTEKMIAYNKNWSLM